MTVALRASAEADALVGAPQRPAAEERADAADMLEELIAAHRQALRELAPHQERRRVRVDTAWHITELGLLLRVRGQVHAAAEQTQNPAPSGVHRPERGRTHENTGADRRPH